MTHQENLYNLVGGDYNATRKADPYISQRLKALLNPEKGSSYLDIGCGTGNYTIAMSESGLDFAGLDPSETMLAIARKHAPFKNWMVWSAEKIPLDNGLFDGALATLTIHHWRDLKEAFREINRILKINGRIVLFTSLPEQMAGFWLNHYFPHMMQTSIQKMPGLYQIKSACNDAGFQLQYTEIYDIQLDLKDQFLYSGKINAALYLDENFRKGISSFAETDDLGEINTGLENLASDIATGHIKSIQKKFQNNNGDYIFIVLTKVS